MTDIKKIYENGYSIEQYYKEGWQCVLDDDCPMTILVEVTDMYDATGEDEYKDYNYVVSIGLVNKDIHKSIQDGCINGDYECTIEDVIGCYGMNCYLDDVMFQLDEDNTVMQNLDSKGMKIYKSLTIAQACLSEYTCRFTGKQKQYLKFKTDQDAFDYAQKLVENYGDVVMSMIGFYLDRPINLMGETAWDQTEKFHNGEK